METNNENIPLLAILTLHGYTPFEHEGWVAVESRFPILNATSYMRPAPDGEPMLQLDVRALIDAECTINESFGGFGLTEDETKKDAFRNFVGNSFHVFMGAFFSPDDDQVTRETWAVNGRLWEATVGNCGIRTPDEADVVVPDDIFKTFKETIHKLPLCNNWHWFRLYYARFADGTETCEALQDNEPWEDGAAVMEKLPWQETESFYSVRLFLILHKVSQSTE